MDIKLFSQMSQLFEMFYETKLNRLRKPFIFIFFLDSETGNQDKRKCPSSTQETTPYSAPVQVSALNSLCSAYASGSDDNEEISGTSNQKI